MAELKQIEVNGTTYDIAVPGSDYPVIAELLTTDGSPLGVCSSIDENGNYVHYKEIFAPKLYLKASGNAAGEPTLSVGIMVDPSDYQDLENEIQDYLASAQ